MHTEKRGSNPHLALLMSFIFWVIRLSHAPFIACKQLPRFQDPFYFSVTCNLSHPHHIPTNKPQDKHRLMMLIYSRALPLSFTLMMINEITGKCPQVVLVTL
jgi:hypothetical protein